MDKEKKKIYKICLTGGPCAGKTTALAKLKDHFSKDFAVYTVPEVATTIVTSGVKIIPTELTPEASLQLNANMCQMQIDMENFFESVGQAQNKNVIIFSDRGVCDNFAYVTKENKEKILEMKGWTYNFISHERYDMVLHMVTAAIGAEEFYTLANNGARTETVEQAQWLDRAVRKEWSSHPNLKVVDNSSKGFSSKINRVVNQVAEIVGMPATSEIHKYLTEDYHPEELIKHTKYQTFNETIDYLVSAKQDTVTWLSKREDEFKHWPVYMVITRFLAAKDEDRIEKKRIISERTYYELLKQKNKSISTVKKMVQYFFWENTNAVAYFNVETVKIGDKSYTWLRSSVEKNHCPPFIKIAADITRNDDYMTYNLAKL